MRHQLAYRAQARRISPIRVYREEDPMAIIAYKEEKNVRQKRNTIPKILLCCIPPIFFFVFLSLFHYEKKDQD